MSEKTYTLVMNEQEAQSVAWALAQASSESRGYLSRYSVTPEPTDTDLCCNAHKRDYERRLAEHRALQSKYVRLRDIQLRAVLLADHGGEDADEPSTAPTVRTCKCRAGDITLIYPDGRHVNYVKTPEGYQHGDTVIVQHKQP